MSEHTFLDYINRYTTVSSDHEAAFDEYLAGSDYEPARGRLRLTTKIEAFVKEKFADESTRPPSIILTGNAGDGKTYLCRQIIEEFTGKPLTEWSDAIDWDLHQGAVRLSVIKDLSELDEEKGAKMLQHLADSYEAQDDSVFLIAANEGRLRKLLSSSDKLDILAQEVDKQLEQGPDITNKHLIVLNLNKVSTSSYVLELLNWLTAEENWRDSPCPKPERCPIYHNVQKLRMPHVQQQIVRLYQILEHLGIHLTIRDMLIHLVYVLTTGKRYEDFQDDKLEPHHASYYQNFFGAHSSKLQREKITAIHHLRKLDVGRISRYSIDNFIINGEIEEREAYHDMFAPAFDLAERHFLQDRDKYLRGSNSLSKTSEQPPFLAWLAHCRRKLFFEWEDARCQQLLPFNHLDDYLKLLQNPHIKERYFSQILLGLNRAFTELFLDSSEQLYLSSQYSHDTVRSVPLLRLKLARDNIDVQVDKAETHAYNQENPRLILEIYPPARVRADPVRWHLNLLNFEYILRRAHGGMPNILDAECALEIRQLKDTLLVNFAQPKAKVEVEVEFLALQSQGYAVQKIKIADGKLYI